MYLLNQKNTLLRINFIQQINCLLMDKSLLQWLNADANGHFIRKGLTVLSLIFFSLQLQAQPCPCQDQVNVQLGPDCTFELTMDNVESGDCTADATIFVLDPNPENENIVDCAGRWEYGIIDNNTNEFLCGGFVLASDVTGPVVDVSETEQVITNIECVYRDEIINNPATINPNSKFYLGKVAFEDACADCGCSTSVKFYDEINNLNNCSSNVTATMTRRWTGTDCNGNETIVTQTFNFIRPSLNDLTSVSDTTIQTCNPGSINNIEELYPTWTTAFGDELSLDEIDCDYSVRTSEQRFDVCGDGSYNLERVITVLDLCTGQSSTLGSYIVKVGDFEAPEFTGNAQEIDGSPLSELTNNFDQGDFLALENDDDLVTISTTSSTSCSASFRIDKNSLENLFDFDIVDCADVDINVSIFTYGRDMRLGFPAGPVQWRTTNYPLINGIASNIPIGLHALVIQASDGCTNASAGVILFKVKDQTRPTMKCDDQLNVSVTTGNPFIPNLGAYARVDAVDVDEGSTDNCGTIDRLLVRRSVPDLSLCEGSFIALGYDANQDDQIDEDDWFDENNNGVFDEETEYKWEFVDGTWMTPLREFVEFFCCDVDERVVIELWAWDDAVDPLTGMAMPNTNMCRLEALVGDAVDPVISSLPDIRLNCDDPDLLLLQDGTYTMATTPTQLQAIRDRFGEATVSSTECGANIIVETISRNMDPQCPTGTITRTVTVSKTTDSEGTSSTTVEQTIDVVIKHDYSICFPADVTIDCNSPDVTIPGPTYSSAGCDLFAELPYEDEEERFFPSNDPDGSNGCYEIFRTYKILNWCEYDEALAAPPVIVGRDWDGDNGTNPRAPDGDDLPGDEGICVIVYRDFLDDAPDTTWYDRNTDPGDKIPLIGDPDNPDTLSYWWRVISGSDDPTEEDYYSGPFDNNFDGVIGANEETVWGNDPNGPGANDDDDYNYGSNGFWQYTQHIKILDETPPQITVIGQDTFCSNSNLDCSGDVLFSVSATDNCTALEDITYSVFLDVNNDGTGLINVTSNLINNTFSARYPIGTHRLVFQARDICGTASGVEEFVFTVADCLAPTPTCIDKLVVNLMAVDDDRNAISEVWATDFTQGTPIGDCTGQGPGMVEVGNGISRPEVTKFSINRVGDPFQPDSTGVTVTCEDLGQLVPVEVHAIDEAGNNAFCTTFIEVQDNGNLCPAGAATAEIAGAISTESGAMLEEVEVKLSGRVSMNYMTDTQGSFKFSALETNYDYSIEPEKDTEHRNGVSIIDLIQIRRHLIQSELLDSPYRQIAADINRDGDITVRDMIELQKMILHKTDHFEGNTSWRFVDRNYRFNSNNGLTENFPEVINYNDLRRSQLSTDFIAVKVGDLNRDAVTQTGAVQAAPRSVTKALEVFTAEQELQAGQEYTFFLAADLRGFIGAQFTTSLSSDVEIVDLIPGLLGESQIGAFPEKGLITAAWYDVENQGFAEEQLFGLKVRAKANVKLSEVLEINSRMTPAESVQDDKKGSGTVSLKVGAQTVLPDNFRLQTAQPNPFKEKTLVNYQVPTDGMVSFTLTDINGKVVFSSTQRVDKGTNQLRLQKANFPVAGIYFLNVTHQEQTATQKLIHIE
jgi:hypothetical protein